MKKIVIAADLGGTNFRMAAVCEDGELLSRVKYPTPRSESSETLTKAMTDAARECLSNCDGVDAVAISVAVPATVNVETGTIIKGPNLPELDDSQLALELGKNLRLRGLLENDANAAAVGENWLGASRGVSTSVMVTLGTGVGGGIIIGGNVLDGIDGTAGEIGHICVEPNGVKCGCGSFGCVEQYSSASAIVRMAEENISKEVISGIGKDRITSKDIYDMAKEGNDAALEVFNHQGFYLGIVLAGLINTLNPEVIVIGGGAAAGWDLFIPQTQEQIRIRAYRTAAERAKLVRAVLGDDAGILGAARLGFDSC